MIKKIRYLMVAGLAVILPLSPLGVLAAYNDVSTSAAYNIVLDDASTYSVGTDTIIESYSVNATSIAFVVKAHSVITLTSSAKKDLAVSSTSCNKSVFTCSSNSSVLHIECDGNAANHTITITPGSTCTASTGGNTTSNSTGSTGSSTPSSGGGGSAPAPAPAPAPVVPVKTEPKPVVVPETPPPISAPAPDFLKPVSAIFTVGKSQSLTVGGVKHTVKVTTVSKSGMVTLTVQSKPVQLSLKKGETKSIDTDGDKVVDLQVTYVKLVGNKPELKFTPLAVTKKEAVAPAPKSSGSYTFTKNIGSGSSGEEVKQLQIKLNALGYLKVSPNGYYGSATTKAVKAFQKANKIAQVGYVGSGTRNALNKLGGNLPAEMPKPPATSPTPDASTKKASGYTFTKNIGPGSSGEEVKQLQIKLNALGYLKAAPNGYYGSATTNAVKAFQKANKIAQVGNVGPGTRSALNKLY